MSGTNAISGISLVGSLVAAGAKYGTLSNASAFFADLESKQIPNLAWDFESFSDCSPDLLMVNHSATNLQLTAWGTTVKDYLLAH